MSRSALVVSRCTLPGALRKADRNDGRAEQYSLSVGKMNAVWIATLAILLVIICPFFLLYSHKAHCFDSCIDRCCPPIDEGDGKVRPSDPDYAEKSGISADLLKKKMRREERREERSVGELRPPLPERASAHIAAQRAKVKARKGEQQRITAR